MVEDDDGTFLPQIAGEMAETMIKVNWSDFSNSLMIYGRRFYEISLLRSNEPIVIRSAPCLCSYAGVLACGAGRISFTLDQIPHMCFVEVALLELVYVVTDLLRDNDDMEGQSFSWGTRRDLPPGSVLLDARNAGSVCTLGIRLQKHCSIILHNPSIRKSCYECFSLKLLILFVQFK